MPRWAAVSVTGVSPMVEMPSMSAGTSPASAIAARDDSAVRSSPAIPVLRPIREIPIPEMIAPRSMMSFTRQNHTVGPWQRSPPASRRPSTSSTDPSGRAAHRASFASPGASPAGDGSSPSRPQCADCGGSTAYEATSGKGTVFTHTTNAHPYNPAVPVPYNISIVELVEQVGLRFTTNVVECPPEAVRIGMPVRVAFEQHGEVFVPVFVPDPRERES